MLNQTINPADLTLADWLAIANAASVNSPDKWAFYRWSENSNADLSKLTLPDWEAIAALTDHGETWAYYRFKECAA